MVRPAPDSRGTAGFALLLWVDLATGRHNGSETIFVPLALAQTPNAARRELYDKHDKPDAWERACVIRTPPLPPEKELDVDPEESAARLRAIRDGLKSSAAAPAAPTVAAVVPVPARRKRHTVASHPVPVISAALITERRKSVEHRTKFSSEEKKTEFKVMDELLARGETRIVGLKPDWRARMAQMRTDMPTHPASRIEELLPHRWSPAS